MNNPNSIAANIIANEASKKERTSGIIWIVLGGLQVLALLSGSPYGIALLICGGLNLYGGIQGVNRAPKLLSRANVYPDFYYRQKNGIIVASIYNFLIGGIIGVAICAYDWHVRKYIIENRWAFNIDPMEIPGFAWDAL